METEISPKADNSRSNTIFWIVFFLLLLGSVAFTYYRIVVKRDYLISAEADCDPYTEECFVYNCDPQTEECTGNLEEDTSYYKIIKKKAYNIPDCDPNTDENCVIACNEGEEDCSYELCEEGNADGIECVDPSQYTIDNPPEEECEEGDEECSAQEEECAPDDEECLSQADSEESGEESAPADAVSEEEGSE